GNQLRNHEYDSPRTGPGNWTAQGPGSTHPIGQQGCGKYVSRPARRGNLPAVSAVMAIRCLSFGAGRWGRSVRQYLQTAKLTQVASASLKRHVEAFRDVGAEARADGD